MSPQFQRIEEDALLLSRDDREHLVESLLRSLHDESVSGIDPAWIVETERRYLEVKSGQVPAVPGEGLIGQIRQELG